MFVKYRLRYHLMVLAIMTVFSIVLYARFPSQQITRIKSHLTAIAVNPSDIDTSEFSGMSRDVYYFWCEKNKMFEFRHYLSVRSAFLHLEPYRVRLLYQNEPKTEELAHNTWLTELRQNYAFFSVAKLPEKWCENRKRNVYVFLSKHGGIWLHGEVILGGPIDKRWLNNASSVIVRGVRYDEIFIKISPRRNNSILKETNNFSIDIQPVKLIRLIRGKNKLDEYRVETGTVVLNTISPDVPLIRNAAVSVANDAALFFKAAVSLVPEHIWELDNEAGRMLRTAAYGKPEIARPLPDFNHLSPNIAHVVWSNDDVMSFEFYLCVLSLLEVAKFDKVLIHGDGPPTGRYWELLKNHPKLRLVHRTLIDGDKEFIYGTEVKVRAHVADVLRIDIMNRYGGLYVDTDALFFRPLTRELRAYDAVVAPDIAWGKKNFPNVYQNGIMLGKPGAKLWRLYLESMKNYVDSDWLWNCNYGLYRVKERYPETVLSYPRLNTICWNKKCHPYWEPHMLHSSDEEIVEILKKWRTGTFAIHNCGPTAEEHKSPEALLGNNGTTLYGAVGMYVLQQSGKIDFFRKLCNM